MRESVLPDVGEHFAAEVFFACVLVSHQALGSGNNGNSQAAQHLGQVFAAGIDAQTGFGDPLESGNDGLLFAVDILERDLDLPLQAVIDLFDRLLI